MNKAYQNYQKWLLHYQHTIHQKTQKLIQKSSLLTKIVNWFQKPANSKYQTSNKRFKNLLLSFVIAFIYFFVALMLNSAFGINNGSILVDLLIIAIYPLVMVNSLHQTKPFKIKKRQNAIFIILALILAWPICYILVQIIGTWLLVISKYADEAALTNGTNTPSYTILAVFVAPFAEECLFRGIMLQTLRRQQTDLVATILVALYFTTFHGTLIQIPGTLLLSVFNTLLVLTTGKLWPAVISHMAYNSMSYLINALPAIKLPAWSYDPTITLPLYALVMLFLLVTIKLLSFKPQDFWQLRWQ